MPLSDADMITAHDYVIRILGQGRPPSNYLRLVSQAWIEQRDRLQAIADMVGQTSPIGLIARDKTLGKIWRCFHCDEVFTDVKAARLHFGEDQDYEPGCIARVPDEERVLLEKIQELECELALFYDEDGPKDRQMQVMASEHRGALVGAEEAGYDKGVRDMKKILGLFEAQLLKIANMSAETSPIGALAREKLW